MFSSTYQPKNRGRKPRLYTLAKKGYKLSLDDFREIAQHLLQLDKTQLKKIAEDDQTPIWIVTICRALFKEASSGHTKALNELVERLWGKAHQSVDVTTKGREIVNTVFINRCETKEDIKKEDGT